MHRPASFLAVVVSLALVVPLHARVVSNADAGYAFEIPDDWREIPTPIIDRQIVGIRVRDSTARISCSGYEPASNPQPLEGPFLIVLARFRYAPPMPGTITETELQRAVANYLGTPAADLKRGPNPDSPQMNLNADHVGSYFTAPPGFVAEMDDPASKQHHTHAVGFLTVKGSVMLNFSGSKPELAALEPAINRAAASLKVDFDHQVTLSSGLPGVTAWLIILAFLAGGFVMFQAFRKTFRARK